jgi:two-component system sensor histidine kinase YesM
MAIAFASLSVGILVAAIFIGFGVTEESARLASRRYTQQLVHQIARNIEFYIEYMDSVSAIVQADAGVKDYLNVAAKNSAKASAKVSEGISERLSAENARQILQALENARNDISLIALFDNRGGFLSGDSRNLINPFTDPSKQSWYRSAKNARGASSISSSHVENIIADRYQWVISLSREIIDEQGLSLGVLLVDLNYRIIDRICSSVQPGNRGYIFIVDRNGDIVYHPQQQLLYGGLKTENIQQVLDEQAGYFSGDDKGSEKFYTTETMNSTNWKVVGVNYRSEFVEGRDTVRTTYAVWGLVFLTAAMLVSIFIAQRISDPIKQLRSSMRAVEQGNFDIQSKIRSSNEIGELGMDFDIMLGEIRNLLARITTEEEQKRKSELRALQMQINPHFLYNTLDSIIWMAQGGKHDEVIVMSSALARLFRLSISKGREIIDVAAELEHVRNYLTIEKIRYKNKLDYRIEVDEDITKYKIVKIILQPLVENAIYHGIKNNPEGGTIVIAGHKTTAGMILTVQDDGPGMNSETLEHIRNSLSGVPADDSALTADLAAATGSLPTSDSLADAAIHTTDAASSGIRRGSGVGVRNVDERIKLYFGKEYGLEFESGDDGTIVTIRLPAVEGNSEKDL